MILKKNLVLDYNTWKCGDGCNSSIAKGAGVGSTCLLNEEGYMCCLGQWCNQSGVNRVDLLDKISPGSLDVYVGGLSKRAYPDMFILRDTRLSESCMCINDDNRTSIADKVISLRKELKRVGRTLRLKNFPKHILQEIRRAKTRMVKASNRKSAS